MDVIVGEKQDDDHSLLSIGEGNLGAGNDEWKQFQGSEAYQNKHDNDRAKLILSSTPDKHSSIDHDTTDKYFYTKRNNNPSTSHSFSTPTTPYLIDSFSNEVAVLSTRQARKTSPGLAARLKALGFNANRKSSSSQAQLPLPGRLPQEQIKQLDQKLHYANASQPIPLQKSGQHWKRLTPTPISIKPAISKPQLSRRITDSPEVGGTVETTWSYRTSSSTDNILSSSPHPIASKMDTHKYRLPDHINNSNTKTQPNTRQEHIDRGICSPITSNLSYSQNGSDLVHAHSPALDVGSPSPPPPPPPRKNSPPVMDFVPNLDSYFSPGRQRPMSIYTLSRASFAQQLCQLTSLQLPDAESLSSRVSTMPTAPVAAKALINAADQIKSWIAKAAEVIGGLDSDDDVEWAAAGGRDGLSEIELAITRFEKLINVYVSAIEELQSREDIAAVVVGDLHCAVSQMEAIVGDWARIRKTLRTVKEQVEIAMEWEELWNVVLGDIQNEKDELSRLVFEMEERRHKSLTSSTTGNEGVDIGDLKTIVERTASQVNRSQSSQHRSSMLAFPLSPSSPTATGPSMSQDDSSLLALFARMQPLRASLDFLPMRLSVFEARASTNFPTACEELEIRRVSLDSDYKKLESDAESLRKELGEDRWVLVFRGAGRQAQKMYESVERSVAKLREDIDADAHPHLATQSTMTKKIENYEAKKMHYVPAIERILGIIDRGVKDRLTVNGEILCMHNELNSRWKALKNQLCEVDSLLDDLHFDSKSQKLRDSVSSMLSNDRSTINSDHETPGSSPPSSVILSSLGFANPSTPVNKRQKSISYHNSNPINKRMSSLPTPISQPRTTSSLLSRSPAASRSSLASTPISLKGLKYQHSSAIIDRPRWNSSTNVQDSPQPKTHQSDSPLSVLRTPIARSISSMTPVSTQSNPPPNRSPIVRATTDSPGIEDSQSSPAMPRFSLRDRLASPGPYSQITIAKSRSGRRSSLFPTRDEDEEVLEISKRPTTSLAATGRRVSMLPQLKSKATSRESVPTMSSSPLSTHTSQTSKAAGTQKPRWR